MINLLTTKSSYMKVAQIIAWKMRISNNKHGLYLEPAEIHDTLKLVIKATQQVTYLKTNERENKKHFEKLGIREDNEGCLRVYGRSEDSNLSFNQKYPIYIPRISRVTELLAEYAHVQTMYGSSRIIHSWISQFYFIPGLIKIAKKIVKNCVTCTLFLAVTANQTMASIPEAR
jgi:hypothetical protein